jgi:hypothetical protein
MMQESRGRRMMKRKVALAGVNALLRRRHVMFADLREMLAIAWITESAAEPRRSSGARE